MKVLCFQAVAFFFFIIPFAHAEPRHFIFVTPQDLSIRNSNFYVPVSSGDVLCEACQTQVIDLLIGPKWSPEYVKTLVYWARDYLPRYLKSHPEIQSSVEFIDPRAEIYDLYPGLSPNVPADKSKISEIESDLMKIYNSPGYDNKIFDRLHASIKKAISENKRPTIVWTGHGELLGDNLEVSELHIRDFAGTRYTLIRKVFDEIRIAVGPGKSADLIGASCAIEWATEYLDALPSSFGFVAVGGKGSTDALVVNPYLTAFIQALLHNGFEGSLEYLNSKAVANSLLQHSVWIGSGATGIFCADNARAAVGLGRVGGGNLCSIHQMMK